MLKSTFVGLLLCLTCFCGTCAFAGFPKDWDTQAVIYAEVEEVRTLENGMPRKISKQEYLSESLGDVMISLRPLATLTGNLDAALHDKLIAAAHVGRTFSNSDILKAPSEGSKVVVFVHKYDGKYIITHGGVSFFPQDKRHRRSAIFEVTGFDDPRVKEVIETLHKLRPAKDPFIDSIENPHQ
jgi:hypothetical protein